MELAGEARALQVDRGDEAVGVDDVEGDGGLVVGRVGRASEEVGFEQRDSIEAPGGVDQFLNELSFGGGGGLVFVEELAAVGFISGGIFGGKDDGLGGEAVAEGVEGRALFAGFGARAGGVLGVGVIDGGAIYGGPICGGAVSVLVDGAVDRAVQDGDWEC